MYEQFTDRARKVMQMANQEAQRFNHEYIGVVHVLLGLIKVPDCVAHKVLTNLGADLRKVRLEVEKLIHPGPDMVMMGRLPHTPALKRVIETTISIAREFNHNYVGTEHMLLAVIKEHDGIVPRIFQNLGLDEDKVKQEVLSSIWDKMKPAPPVKETWKKELQLPQPQIIYVPPDNAANTITTQALTIKQLTDMLASALKEVSHLQAELGVESSVLKAAEENHAQELTVANVVTDHEVSVLCALFQRFQALLKQDPPSVGDLQHCAQRYVDELWLMHNRFQGDNND